MAILPELILLTGATAFFVLSLFKQLIEQCQQFYVMASLQKPLNSINLLRLCQRQATMGATGF